MTKIPVFLDGRNWCRRLRLRWPRHSVASPLVCHDFAASYLELRGAEDGAKATLFLSKRRFAGSLRVELLDCYNTLFWVDRQGCAKLLWPSMESILKQTLAVDEHVYVRMILS